MHRLAPVVGEDDGTGGAVPSAPHLARAVAQAGAAATPHRRAWQAVLCRAIATRRGYCDWTVDHPGWVVMLLSPERQDFSDRTLAEALAWCLVWLMAPEIGFGRFIA